MWCPKTNSLINVIFTILVTVTFRLYAGSPVFGADEMPDKVTPIANNHPVPLSDGLPGSTGPYPSVPKDDRVISTEDLGPADRRDMRSSNTGK